MSGSILKKKRKIKENFNILTPYTLSCIALCQRSVHYAKVYAKAISFFQMSEEIFELCGPDGFR